MEQEQQSRGKEKEARVRAARRRDGMRILAGVAIVAAIMTGVVYLLSRGGNEPADGDASDLSAAVPVQGQEHIAIGASHPPYNSNPPSSGWHYQNPAPKGFHETPVPDEYLIHNLEHGDVWIAYHPRIATSTKESIRDLTRGKVVAAPRETNDFDISLVAWGRVDHFNLDDAPLDMQRITAFIGRYRNTGPEKVF